MSLYVYTILIILWGAWVRISKSGDGCGDSWPLCDGKVLPSTTNLATWIEFSHRLTTGLFGILVIIMLIWAHKKYKDNQALKKMVWLSFIFTITEALLGAMLVKLGLVTDNDSFLRLFVMGLHQVNSLLLSGFIGLAFVVEKTKSLTWSRSASLISFFFLLLAATGAIASLSTTLYPSTSLIAGIKEDFASDSHWLIRWRSLHPIVAIMIGGGLLYALILRGSKTGFTVNLKRLLIVFVTALVVGIVTLVLLSPMWLKLVHLTLAHVLWLFLLIYLIDVVSKLVTDRSGIR